MVGSAPTGSRVSTAMRLARLLAGVLAFPGHPCLLVSSSRIGTVWLLRELISEADEHLGKKMWNNLAALAWAVAVAGCVGAGDGDAAQKEQGEGSKGEGKRRKRR